MTPRIKRWSRSVKKLVFGNAITPRFGQVLIKLLKYPSAHFSYTLEEWLKQKPLDGSFSERLTAHMNNEGAEPISN
jgi:hypothetical protein